MRRWTILLALLVPQVATPATLELPSFAITAQLASFDGPEVTGPVRPGAVLHFEAPVPHPASELPVTTYLYWQLYADTGEAVEGRGTRETVVLAGGGTHERRFTLPVAGLPEGRYHVALTHQLATDLTLSRQEVVSFDLRAPRYTVEDLRLNDIAAAEFKDPWPEGRPLKVAFTVESDEPLRDIPVRLRLRPSGDGRAVRDFDLFISQPANRHTLAFELPAENLPPGARLNVEVTVMPPLGQPAEISTGLVVRPRDIAVRTVPGVIPLGNTAEVGIEIPPGYEPPLEIVFTAEGEVRLNPNSDRVTGTVEGLSRHRAVEGRLRATVRSANGFTSSAETAIRFAPRDGNRLDRPFSDEATLLAAVARNATPAARAALGDTQLRYARYFAGLHRQNGDPGDFVTALGYALAASRALPDSPLAWELVGELTLPLVQAPEMRLEAETAFRQLVRLDPEDARARRALFACLMAGGAVAEAVEEGTWLVARDPVFRREPALEQFNLACLQAMRTRTGAEAYRALLARDPDQPEVRLALAVLLRAQGLTEDAQAEVAAATTSARTTAALRTQAAGLLAAWQEPWTGVWEEGP